MAKFTLVIERDNAAFEGDVGAEVSRILHDIAEDINGDMMAETGSSNIHDLNGNPVGRWHYKA